MMTGLIFFRIHTEVNGGAWCPLNSVSDDTYSYLQIDLGELKVVTMVETQGRFGYGQVILHVNILTLLIFFDTNSYMRLSVMRKLMFNSFSVSTQTCLKEHKVYSGYL